MRLKEINPEIKISVSYVFFQGYDIPKNISIVEMNKAIKHLCLSQGWGLIGHGNITIRHLEKDGIHLTSKGIRLFAINLVDHIQSG